MPLSVGALGLGEISLKSALNQVLVAEIPVTADASDDLGKLDVRLASAETFQRFGLDRPQFLNTLDFSVEGNRIRVTSSAPVSEPFVSLLLEINWPQGRLLREYTMLLDPPSFARDGAVQPAAALPVVDSPAPAIKRIDRPAGQQAGEAAAVATPAAADERLVAGPDGNSYGPVRANETLWAIAERLRADDTTSLNAMMVALYRANPEAFAGNINLLKRGAILRVPAAEEVAALSDGEAASEVRSQNEAWQAGLDSSPGAARLQLVPPAEKPAAAATPVPAGQPAASADTAQVKALEQQLAESRRLLELKDSQLKALQDRLRSGAEAPVEMPVEAPIEAPVERLPVEDSTEAGTDADEVAVVDEDSAASAEPAAAAPAERAAAKRRPQPKSSDGSLLDTLGGLIFNSYFLIAAAAVVLAGLFVVFGRRRMAKADDDSTGRFPTTLPRGSSVGGAAEGEPTLRDGFIVEESAAQRTADLTAERTAVAAAPARGGRKMAGDSETALERTISTDGAVEIDQADVIAEAEFHMAYGLYDQAAELLVRALRDNPDRRDLRLKLLEVYFIWENKPAFLKEAQTFHRQPGAAESADWNKVLIMGKQICPGEALFAAGASAAGLDIALDGEGSDSIDFNLDGDAGQGVDLDLTGARPGPVADLLDFDLGEIAGTDDTGVDDTGLMKTEIAPGLSGSDSPTIEAPYGGDYSPTMETPTVEFRSPDAPTVETPTLETPAAGTMETPTIESTALAGTGRLLADLEGHDHTEEINVEDLGLDLTGLDVAAGDMGTGLHAAVDEARLAGGGDEGEIFDIGEADTGVDEDLSDLLQSLEGDATSEMRGISLDEGTLDLPAIGTAMEKSAAGRSAGAPTPGLDDTAEQPRGELGVTALGEESGELSLDFDIGAEDVEDSEPTSVVAPGPGRRPEGPTMTEVGTKLDLARAYVDMGDPEGARSILNEVLEEGDPAQQQEARKLLDELAD
jgi:pilus assembly protein FimV